MRGPVGKKDTNHFLKVFFSLLLFHKQSSPTERNVGLNVIAVHLVIGELCFYQASEELLVIASVDDLGGLLLDFQDQLDPLDLGGSLVMWVLLGLQDVKARHS